MKPAWKLHGSQPAWIGRSSARPGMEDPCPGMGESLRARLPASAQFILEEAGGGFGGHGGLQ
jgi:hypothetical protein